MNAGANRVLLALGWLWLLAVAGYMIWSTFAYEGLYRWLTEWQMDHWGQYYRKWTAVLPGLLLASPALIYLGWRARLRRAAEAASPAAQARTLRRTAWATLLIGLLGIAIGGGAYWLSQGRPDGTEPAERIDLARLGSGPVPQTKVRLEGRLDPEASTGLARGGVEDSVTYYAGFRLENEARDAPVRLFVERSTRPQELTTLQAFLPEQTGYLVENGVPERALADLRRRGVRVASPHFLLKTGSGALREPYYIVAAVAGGIGFICLLAGFARLLQARRRAWLATAIRPDGSPVEPSSPPPA